MIEVSGTNSQRDIGTLTQNLIVSGTECHVRCTIPRDHSASVKVSGTSATVEIGGEGGVSLEVTGTMCDVLLAPTLNTCTTITGTNISVRTQRLAESARQADNFDFKSAGSSGRDQLFDGSSSSMRINVGEVERKADDDQKNPDHGGDTDVYEPDSESPIETQVYHENNNSGTVVCPSCGATLQDQNPQSCS